MASGYEPPPRWGAVCSLIEDQIFMWGGYIKDSSKNKLYRIEIFDPFLETWKCVTSRGTLPKGLCNCACTSIGQYLYVYGGLDGSSIYGFLSQLDTKSLEWRQLNSDGPTMKDGCGMVSHGSDLVLFGGYGFPSGHTPPQSQFITSHSHNDGRGWTNELHLFHLNEGLWSSPAVSGAVPPPCSDFSFTLVDDHHAVLFGGFQPEQGKTNDVYILDLTTLHWNRMYCQLGNPCPMRRSDHAAFCLGYGEMAPQLMVTGGICDDDKVLNDMWMLDLVSEKWSKVEAVLQSRFKHCVGTFTLSPGLVEVVSFGGCHEWSRKINSFSDLPKIAKTSLLYFRQLVDTTRGSPTGVWILAENHNTNKQDRLRNKMMQMAYQASITAPLVASNAQRERELEGRVKEAEDRVREAMRLLDETMEQCDKRVEVAEEKAAGNVQGQWIVGRGEIHITEEVLGHGAYAVVKVAELRGTRVAAKSLFHEIRSDYYVQHFIREMNIASRVRHPNLVQFIGACMDDGIILTELMPTNLRKELEKKDCNMSQDQLVSVGLDVARALNYLHLMKPEAIIHRDISSANVLLELLFNNQWRAKVSDYGSVSTLQHLQSAVPGNPVYAAPEVLQEGLLAQSPKMDIFSFGVLLVEMFTGCFPEVSSRQRMIASIENSMQASLIQQCTHRDRNSRPSAADVIAKLETWQ